MKNFNWKGMVPHAVAVLVFLVLTLAYFSPVLEGKDISTIVHSTIIRDFFKQWLEGVGHYCLMTIEFQFVMG